MNDVSLEMEIKQLIVQSLNLEDTPVESIDTNAPLFGEGLGLDSIDALELGLALKKKYNITLPASSEENKKHFASVASLAQFVATHRS